MPAIKFRDLKKELPSGRLPTDLEAAIRERAYRRRISLSAALTEVVALGLGRDPSQYGLPSPLGQEGKRRKLDLPS